MKRISIVIVFLFLCALTASAIGPRSPAGSGGTTFTGGTLTQNLTMSDGTIIELATGTQSNLSLRFRTDTNTGIYSPNGDEIRFRVGAAGTVDLFRLSPHLIWMETTGGFTAYLSQLHEMFLTNSDIIAGSTADGYPMMKSRFGTTTGTRPVFTFTGDPDTGLGRQASGKPSLISDGVECIRVASSGTLINTFTQLGSDSPKLKCRLLTGTTGSSEGDETLVFHGIATLSNIVSFSPVVRPSGSSGVPPEYSSVPEFQYSSSVGSTVAYISLSPTNSGTITNSSFSILIWYKE